MGKVPPSREGPLLTGFSAVVLNAYLQLCVAAVGGLRLHSPTLRPPARPSVDPFALSALFLIAVLVFKAAYVVSAIDQICNHLSIHCFSVKRKQ